MKIAILIFTFFLFRISHSQYYAYEYLKPEIVIKNGVKKSIEYDYDDSTNFFAIFPNGNYNVFDHNGEIIESNFYMKTVSKDGKTINSYQTIKLFIYNNKGEKTTLWVYDSDGYMKITRALFNYTDTLEKQEITHDLQNGLKTTKDVIAEKLKDTLITEKYTKIIEFDNQDKNDTFKITTLYFSNNLNDSIIQYFPKTNYKILERFSYENKNISTYSKYLIYKDSTISSTKIKYNENELPIEMWYGNYKNNNIVNVNHTGLKYEYFEKRNGLLFDLDKKK
jgi:hypothetical protein